MTMEYTIKSLFEADEIARRIAAVVDEMGGNDCQTNFVMVGVLRGSFVFLADLVRELDRLERRPKIDFMTLESYHGGTESTGVPRMIKDVSVDLRGAHVLLVDDILDTGRTLSFAVKHLRNKGADIIQTCVLLDKPSRRLVDIHADYVGFTIEDTFVVGYGLDYDNHYRELPYIGEVVQNAVVVDR